METVHFHIECLKEMKIFQEKSFSKFPLVVAEMAGEQITAFHVEHVYAHVYYVHIL